MTTSTGRGATHPAGWPEGGKVREPAFCGQLARTRRFTLGVPHRFTVSPDGERVLFLRSVSGTDPRTRLWLYQGGTERLLADPTASSTGVSGYATDEPVRLVAYPVDGELWTLRTDGGPARHLRTPGRVRDPRPSPHGTLIAYLSEGALRLVRADGTGDRVLLAPETPEVAYGLPDHTAEESIGRTRGYWWSPAGDALLVARVDTSPVTRWYLPDPSRPDRAPEAVPCPAAGTANALTSLHLVTVDGEHTRVRLPLRVPAEEAPHDGWGPAFEYLVSADWDHLGPLATLHSRDQRTLWSLRIDPATGAAEPLDRLTDEGWAQPLPGTPAHTASGTAVLPRRRGDSWSVRIGGTLAPEGLQVREVLGVVGERVLFTANEDPTEVHVWSHDPSGGFRRLTREAGVHTATVGGNTLVVASGTPGGPVVTVVRAGQPTGRIAVCQDEPLVTPRPRLLTLGRRELRGRLHLPSWYRPGAGRLPVVLFPYNGPGLQVVTRARAWYTMVSQWFAEQGFAVLTTDGRGTPGRGVRWMHAIRGDRLRPVLTDQVDALHAAAERYDALDLGRVGIRGWSFSGYLAAGAVLLRPDVFHAAVAGAPSAERRLYDTYWEERFLGHPELRPQEYATSSLAPLAGRLTRPLMLVHGLADTNVHPAHTLRLSSALLAAGRPHRVLLLPGEGHLVTREGVADTLLRQELDFLRTALPVRSGDARPPS